MTFAEALALGLARLQGQGIEEPARDVRRLLAFAAGVDPGRLTVMLPDDLPEPAFSRYLSLIDRRAKREPVSHLTGLRAFWGREFIVTPDVLDPRPETEHLIEAALETDFASVLDLGTGSGVILATLLAERPGAEGLGADLSPSALTVARQNLDRHAPRGNLVQSDWFDAVSGRFDLIVSNPPYIAAGEMAGLAPELSFEPRIALTDEGDGLTAYRIIAAKAAGHLTEQGRLIVEIGTGQGAAVAELFRAAGLKDVEIRRDLADHDRNVLAKR